MVRKCVAYSFCLCEVFYTMLILAAKPLIEEMKSDLKKRTELFRQKTGRSPHLAVVLVGNDPASVIYTRNKGKNAVEVGMEHQSLTFPDSASPTEVKSEINRLNSDPHVDGILIQRPLPKQFREEEVLTWISPEKDVDAFHPANVGKLVLGLPCFHPCTPAGIMALLKFYKIEISGKTACVIGRSATVGKPMAALLLQANATVIQAHSKTKDLEKLSSQADILIAAAGRPGLIQAQHIKQGAVVIDVGIHRTPDGLVGDVLSTGAAGKASALSPVPGGVGPMTIMMLLSNTVMSAEARN